MNWPRGATPHSRRDLTQLTDIHREETTQHSQSQLLPDIALDPRPRPSPPPRQNPSPRTYASTDTEPYLECSYLVQREGMKRICITYGNSQEVGSYAASYKADARRSQPLVDHSLQPVSSRHSRSSQSLVIDISKAELGSAGSPSYKVVYQRVPMVNHCQSVIAERKKKETYKQHLLEQQ